jgi:hypothetical protein
LCRIAVDPIFPPPEYPRWGGKFQNLPIQIYEGNKFELIFDEILEGDQLRQQYYQNVPQGNSVYLFSDFLFFALGF